MPYRPEEGQRGVQCTLYISSSGSWDGQQLLDKGQQHVSVYLIFVIFTHAAVGDKYQVCVLVRVAPYLEVLPYMGIGFEVFLQCTFLRDDLM